MVIALRRLVRLDFLSGDERFVVGPYALLCNAELV